MKDNRYTALFPYQWHDVCFILHQLRFYKGRQFGFGDTKHTKFETYN